MQSLYKLISKPTVLLHVTLFVFFVVYNFFLPIQANSLALFADPIDYLTHAKLSFFSKGFWLPEPNVHMVFPRPFVVAFFLKLVGSDIELFILLQKYMYTLACFVFILSIFPFFVTKSMQYASIVLGWILLQSWNILGWNDLLLSEGLTFTFCLLWLSSVIFLYKKYHWATVLFFIFNSIFFTFTRDSCIYVMLVFAVLYAVVYYFMFDTNWKTPLWICTVLLCNYIAVGYASKVGERYRLPIMHSIITRILPHAEYAEYFVQRGMPQAEVLLQKFPQMDYDNLSLRYQMYAFYKEEGYEPFTEWVGKKGKSVYSSFLITHPRFALLVDEPNKDLKKLCSYSYQYFGNAQYVQIWFDYLYPKFGLISAFIFSLLPLYYFRKTMLHFIPIILFISFMLYAILLYNADAFEIERHLYHHYTVVQLCGFFSLLCLLDYFLEKKNEIENVER